MAYPPSTLPTVYSSQPASTGSTADYHAALHNRHDTAIGETVTELGSNPSSTGYATLTARLASTGAFAPRTGSTVYAPRTGSTVYAPQTHVTSTAAHTATSITFTAVGSIASTDVQSAVAEVATDAAAAYAPKTGSTVYAPKTGSTAYVGATAYPTAWVTASSDFASTGFRLANGWDFLGGYGIEPIQSLSLRKVSPGMVEVAGALIVPTTENVEFAKAVPSSLRPSTGDSASVTGSYFSVDFFESLQFCIPYVTSTGSMGVGSPSTVADTAGAIVGITGYYSLGSGPPQSTWST